MSGQIESTRRGRPQAGKLVTIKCRPEGRLRFITANAALKGASTVCARHGAFHIDSSGGQIVHQKNLDCACRLALIAFGRTTSDVLACERLGKESLDCDEALDVCCLSRIGVLRSERRDAWLAAIARPYASADLAGEGA